jgi:acyl carrier protein
MNMMADRLMGAEDWARNYLAELLDVAPAEIDADQPFERFGLDSAATVAFASDMGRWLGVKLDSRILFEYDTISAVSAHLRDTLGDRVRG